MDSRVANSIRKLLHFISDGWMIFMQACACDSF